MAGKKIARRAPKQEDAVMRKRSTRRGRTLRRFITPTKRFVAEDSTKTHSSKKRKAPPPRRSVEAKSRKRKSPTTISDSKTDRKTMTHSLLKTFRNRVRSQMSKVRFCKAFLRAYDSSGWQPAQERIRPEEELKGKELEIERIKLKIREIILEIDQLRANDRQVKCIVDANDSGIEVSDLFCSRCGGNSEDEEDNDIIICDFKGCFRAYHQRCLVPPLTAEDIPAGDADWFCDICECLSGCLDSINDEFGASFTTPAEVFADVRGDSARRAGRQLETAMTSEDEDYYPDDEVAVEEEVEESGDEDAQVTRLRKESEQVTELSSQGIDEEVDALSLPSDLSDPEEGRARDKPRTRSSSVVTPPRLSVPLTALTDAPPKGRRAARKPTGRQKKASASSSSDEESEEREDRREVHPTSLIVEGKRRRTIVDYRKLNDALFGSKSDSDEEEGKGWREDSDQSATSDDDKPLAEIMKKLVPRSSPDRRPQQTPRGGGASASERQKSVVSRRTTRQTHPTDRAKEESRKPQDRGSAAPAPRTRASVDRRREGSSGTRNSSKRADAAIPDQKAAPKKPPQVLLPVTAARGSTSGYAAVLEPVWPKDAEVQRRQKKVLEPYHYQPSSVAQSSAARERPSNRRPSIPATAVPAAGSRSSPRLSGQRQATGRGRRSPASSPPSSSSPFSAPSNPSLMRRLSSVVLERSQWPSPTAFYTPPPVFPHLTALPPPTIPTYSCSPSARAELGGPSLRGTVRTPNGTIAYA